MTAKEEIGARVDALSHAHQGDAFVTAVQELAEELGPDGRPLLQQVLLERAADEDDFQQAIRQRAAAKGWTRRTFARIERVWRDDRADTIAAALEKGDAGAERVAREIESLRHERGRAALVLDELSRHRNARVRAWVPVTAAEILGEGGERLVLSLTRDRHRGVREAAVTGLALLGPEAARKASPDARRRLRSPDMAERIAAAWALAELGDETSLPLLEERAATAESADERRVARAAELVLRGDEGAIASGLGEHDRDEVPALAVAARILASEATVDALREVAARAPDESSRAACAAQLERLPREA